MSNQACDNKGNPFFFFLNLISIGLFIVVWFITIIFISQCVPCFNWNIIITTKNPSKLKKTQSILWLEGTVQSCVIKHTNIKGNTKNVKVKRIGSVDSIFSR